MRRLSAKSLLPFAFALLTLCAVAGDFQAVSSVDTQWRPEGARLTLGAALHIAEAEVSKKHISLSDYSAPVFRYSHDKDEGYVWAFIYDGKVPMPGNHFLVVVNDRTQRAAFVPGE